jgi:ATP/maltotriose-dependent transcriptional regulator MalT/DNA-binding SARP family transcriptional activator
MPRSRLVSVIDQRFDRQITILSAGAGLGKSTLLVAGLSSPSPASAIDVWFPFRHGDISAISLATELLAILGSDRLVTGEVEVDATMVADSIWMRSPDRVCLVFDDGHVLPEAGEAEALLSSIVERLPPNGHIVFASRRSPPFKFSRQLARSEAIVLDGEILRYSDDECDQFARQRDVDPAVVRKSGGWPALAELMTSQPGGQHPKPPTLKAYTSAGTASLDFVWEEVLSSISLAEQSALRLLALAGSLDAASFAALSGFIEPLHQLLDRLPLVTTAGERFGLHDVWTDALMYRVDPATASEARLRVAAFASKTQDYERAFHVLVGGGLWAQALESVRFLLVSERHTREPAVLQEWLRVFPEEFGNDPVVVLLEGMSRRGEVPESSVSALERAVDAFAARGDQDAELVALAALSTMALNRGDLELATRLYVRVLTLKRLGSTAAVALLSVMNATLRLSEGYADDAVRIVTSHPADGPHALRGMVAMVSARCLLEAGRLSDALDLLDTQRTVLRPYRLGTETFRNRAIWQLGRHDEALGLVAASVAEADRAGRHHDRDLAAMMHAGYLALMGRTAEAKLEIKEFERVGGQTLPFVQMNYRLARSMVKAVEGDDVLAAHELRLFLADSPFLAALPRAVLGMFYVLVEEQRSLIDELDLRGMNATIREVARAIVAARVKGDLEPARSLAGLPTEVLSSHFTGPWLVELAVVCLAAGNSALQNLLDDLGVRHRDVVVELEKSANVAVSRAASAIAQKIPAAAPSQLRVLLLGPIEVRVDAHEAFGELKRDRVRALLLLVVLHRRIARERAAAILWPDLDVSSGANNLRTTLNYLQRTLEPNRPADQPPYFLRQDGPWLTFAQGSSVDVDLWKFESHFAAAVAAEHDYDPGVAVIEFRAAAELWRGELGIDVANAYWAEEHAELLRSRFVQAGLRAGELLCGRDDNAALALGLRVRAIEPWAEPVHLLVARAHRNLGQPLAASRALERGRDALTEIGLDPSVAFLDFEADI